MSSEITFHYLTYWALISSNLCDKENYFDDV